MLWFRSNSLKPFRHINTSKPALTRPFRSPNKIKWPRPRLKRSNRRTKKRRSRRLPTDWYITSLRSLVAHRSVRVFSLRQQGTLVLRNLQRPKRRSEHQLKSCPQGLLILITSQGSFNNKRSRPRQLQITPLTNSSPLHHGPK